MSVNRGKVARQGTNDGLCGIYCLINAVRNDDRLRGSSREDLLRYLLEAATRLNNLTAAKISGGYEAHELVDIFNVFAASFDLSLCAQLLATLRRSLPDLSLPAISNHVFDRNGHMVIHTKDHEHWFLAYAYDSNTNQYLVEDSSSDYQKTAISLRRALSLGLAILPKDEQ